MIKVWTKTETVNRSQNTGVYPTMKSCKPINLLTILILSATVASGRAQELGTLRQLGYGGGQPQILEPGKSLAVPVGKPATVLRFEQTLVPGAAVAAWKATNQKAREKGDRLPDRLTVAQYVVRYADGRELPVNIRYGESVGAWKRDWWNPVEGFIYDLAFAPVVWTQPLEKDGLEHAVVYRLEWPNPRPAVAIEKVTLNGAPGLEGGRLLVFAMTTENRPQSGNTYFVAPTGDDAGPGSFEQPWATLHQAAATIKAGDKVYVRGGTYQPAKHVAFLDLKAPEGQRTAIIGYPGETATFDCLNVLWDMSPDRDKVIGGAYPHDQAMILAFRCERMLFRNLHIIQSRARGFGMGQGVENEISYCSLYKSFGPGISFGNQRRGRVFANTVWRGCSLTMGPDGKGGVGGIDGGRKYISYDGKPMRNPPMEALDSGRLHDSVLAYNEVGWPDKECMLIDGPVNNLRVHHNYVHDSYNRPWVGGIAPNGYGKQQDIEIDHNIAHGVGTGFGLGAEGGGSGQHVRIHHNLAWDCLWNGFGVTGAWKDAEASLSHVSIYNNTSWHNGHLDGNQGPAGGISVSFPRKVGAFFHGKQVELKKSAVTDVTIANNLILQPRDYVQGLVNDGDPVAAGIVFTHNLTDLVVDSERITGENRLKWRSVRDDKLIVTEKPLLRDPAKRDFRLLAGTPAINGGRHLEDGSPTYIGAFGPGAKWVEDPHDIQTR